MITGIVLMLVGAIIFVFAFFRKRRHPSKQVGKDDRSVSIKGSNYGLVNTGDIGNNAQPSPETNNGHTALVIVSIIVECIGIGVVIWHAFHIVQQ